MAASNKIQRATERLPNWTDEVNRQIHIAIARKIRHQPTLLGIAVENLRMWKRRNDRELQPILRRWKLILLTWGLDEILDFLAEPGEEAAKMRRMSPFCGILNEHEQRQAVSGTAA